MIRDTIEADMKLVEDSFREYKIYENTEEQKQAWTRIQLKLYRYSNLLAHMEDNGHAYCTTLKNCIAQEKMDLAIQSKKRT